MNESSHTLSKIREKITDFERNIQKKTSDHDVFLSIDELEEMMSRLNAEVRDEFSDMVNRMLSGLDERQLLQKKKGTSGLRNTRESKAQSDQINTDSKR